LNYKRFNRASLYLLMDKSVLIRLSHHLSRGGNKADNTHLRLERCQLFDHEICQARDWLALIFILTVYQVI